MTPGSLDGRPEILDEVQSSDGRLRAHLAERFQALLDDPAFLAAIPGDRNVGVAESRLQSGMAQKRQLLRPGRRESRRYFVRD